jgi:hypothetical protein
MAETPKTLLKASGDLGKSGLDVMSGDHFGALESCGEKSMVSEEIDFSGQTAGGLEESLLSRGLEENRLGTGESEAVLKVGGQLIASQRGEMETDDDALGESFVNGH